MLQSILKVTQKESILYGGGWGLMSGLIYFMIALDWFDNIHGQIEHKNVHIFWKIYLLPAWIIDQLFIENTTFGVYLMGTTDHNYTFYIDSMLLGGILGFVIIGMIKTLEMFRK